MQAALGAAVDADVAQLVQLGFLPHQAREALEETGGDIQAASEWLFAACC